MGCIISKGQAQDPADAEHTHQIDKRIAQENIAEKNVLKLLLLGAGDSGKSTIFKQIKVLFQTGFDIGEKKNYTNVIHTNVYQSIKILLDGALQFAEDEPEHYTLLPENKEVGEELAEVSGGSEQLFLTGERAKQIDIVWNDPAIQATYQRASELQLPDCTAYFMKDLQRLAAPGYIPTQDDVLHARVRTTGIVETEFSPTGEQKKNGELYRLFDVGGQRNERRKWIHLFEGVTAVIFCVSLSEYDQVLFEDEDKNRMIESKELFEWIIKLPFFEKTSFLLFLNKFDIFEKKINQVTSDSHHKGVPLNTCEWFSDYEPSSTTATSLERPEVENAYAYVKQKFEALYEANTAPQAKEFRVFKVYKTTALDEQLVKRTFRLIHEALSRKKVDNTKLVS